VALPGAPWCLERVDVLVKCIWLGWIVEILPKDNKQIFVTE